jgi:hypothetical protein
MLTVLHQSLARGELLPSEHLVDMGYTGRRMLVDSQLRYGVVIVGPVVEVTSWQAHAADAARAGMEGTHARAIRRCGLRRCRYIGLVKTRLQHVITIIAINLVRVAEWHNDIPSRLQQTRVSHCLRLYVWWLDRSGRLNSPPVSCLTAAARDPQDKPRLRRRNGSCQPNQETSIALSKPQRKRALLDTGRGPVPGPIDRRFGCALPVT